MPAKPSDERVAREVADTLVKDDGVELGRAKEAIKFVLEEEKGRAGDALKIYRAARRRLRIDDEPTVPEEDDLDDDARPTLVVPPKPKPGRKGTRKDTPAAKKDKK